MIKADKIELRHSELTTVTKVVPKWETAVLRAAHAGVKVLGEQTLDRDAPDVEDEYKRLCDVYVTRKEDGSREFAVTAAYGPGVLGLNNLATAIAAAVVDAPKKQKAAA